MEYEDALKDVMDWCERAEQGVNRSYSLERCLDDYADPGVKKYQKSTNSTNSTPSPLKNKNAAHRLGLLASAKNYDLPDLLDWYRQDMDDLAAMSDEDLSFVVDEYVRNRDYYPPFRPLFVRCIDSQHFTRTSHKHLGRCAKKVPPPNPKIAPRKKGKPCLIC
jgi:hypothetical protein